MSAFRYLNAFKTTRFLDDPSRHERDFNNLSSYFVLYFYLRESLGKALGTYHEIYGHYLIVRSIKKEICCIYIRTTVGHIYLYREIEEAIQGFCQACSDQMVPNLIIGI